MQSETIQHYAANPPRNHEIVDADIHHKEANRVCGDDIEVFLVIDSNVLKDWSFIGNTAMITTACSGLFGEIAVGEPLDTILSWTQKDIIEMTEIEVSPRRKRAQVLALLATRNAIHKHRKDDTVDDFSDVLIDPD